MLFRTEDPRVLAALTALPLDFVWLVCEKASQTGFWHSERMGDLASVLSEKTLDLIAVRGFLWSAMESYWANVWTPQLVLILERLRGGIVVGGERQWWVDSGFEEEFGTL